MLNAVDQQFHDLCHRIFTQGHTKGDRTGHGTTMLPGQMLRFDCTENKMPVLSTRLIPTKAFRREMHWFISGNSSIKYLRDHKVGVWDQWFIPGTDRYDETAEPVSVQTRLNRLSKNRNDEWVLLNGFFTGMRMRARASGKATGKHSDYTTYTVWDGRANKFVPMQYPDEHLPELMELLDTMHVPAYPLVDADIGAGGYGPNWRHWQDTQMIPVHGTDLRDDYLKQGYVLKGFMHGVRMGDVDDAIIMHREIDQLQNAISMLKVNPDDRRMIVTAWNPGRTWQAALPPCHLYLQFVSWEFDRLENYYPILERAGLKDAYFDRIKGIEGTHEWFMDQAKQVCIENNLPTRYLTAFVLLRSSDAGLGAISNVAQYAYLLHLVGHVVNMEPHELITVGVDVHIYQNQETQLKELLLRDSHPDCDPRIVIKGKFDNIDQITFDDVDLSNYFAQSKIDIPVAV